ncbi:MAG: hypothetical protein AB7Q37_07230 [Pyrinomonadaceae bacterium]
MKRAIVLSFFGFCMMFATTAALGQKSSVAGEWDGSFNTPGGARPFKFILAVDGEKLTGTAKRSSGDVPITGTIKGEIINFSYTINYGGNDLTLIYSGRVSGDSMSGTVSFGGNAEESWTAKRAASK